TPPLNVHHCCFARYDYAFMQIACTPTFASLGMQNIKCWMDSILKHVAKTSASYGHDFASN
ncbi:MAG: hypothetical protein AAF664_25880, partial [Planctomycetota bacterium]